MKACTMQDECEEWKEKIKICFSDHLQMVPLSGDISRVWAAAETAKQALIWCNTHAPKGSNVM